MQITLHHLKQKPSRAWLTANTAPADAVLYVGIDWSEARRTPAIERGWKPWTVRFPMCDPPYLTKDQMLDWARAEGLRPPRAYAEGFSHNNCFGACVRAGQRQWLHLLNVAPERYAAAEAEEERLRATLGDVAVLRRRRNGISRPLPLRELRELAEGRTPPDPGIEASRVAARRQTAPVPGSTDSSLTRTGPGGEAAGIGRF